ncbi:MAG: MMPL family transporter [Spirochaetes bacterium]|nr:MMPL family transporter [Spirochaetota bacterium]
MKIQRINKFFRSMGEFQIKYRWIFLVCTLFLIMAGFFGMQKVSVTTNNDQWFDNSEQIQIAEDEFEDQFGNNESIGLLVESEDVFHPEVLKMIRDIGKELEDKVPFADEITSLTELEISVGTEEGMEIINPFENGIPEDPEKLKEIRNFILSRSAVVNKLVSDDGTETWISLSLKEYPQREEWEKEGKIDPLFQDGEVAIAIITDPKWKSDLYTIKAAGMPYTETEERDFFGHETKVRVFSGFIVMIVLLSLFLRSFRGVIVPVFSLITSIVTVFGFMGWLGISLDSSMVTLPVLLGMALSVGYSIHLFNAFKRFMKINGNPKDSIISAVEETGWPLFFTAITTMGSVMSFAVAGLMPIRWLGFTCSAVVFTVYLFVIILIPIIMSFGKEKSKQNEQPVNRQKSDGWFQKSGELILAWKRSVLVFFLLIIIIFAPGILKIKVNMDMFEFMGLKISYIQRVYDIVNSKLGSYLSYNITVTYDEPDAVKNPDVLNNFDTLVKEVGSFELTKKNKGVPKIFSILDIVKEMNQTLHGDDKAYYKIPDNAELIAQLLLLYEMSGGTKTLNWVNEDYSMLRASVETKKFDANSIVKELKTIEKLGKELFPGAKVNIIGGAVRFAEVNNKIVSGEVKSFIMALIVIGILLAFVFGSFKTGLIGMIPNITPLLVLSGFMGYFSFQLDMMSMTIIPMLLGIAVDDTIHFINHIKYEFEKCGDYRKAILESFNVIGKTLTMTTIILSATFIMYMFSPINTLFRIGLLASMGLVSALVADFLMTPVLILMVKPFGKSSEEISDERFSRTDLSTGTCKDML